MADTLTQEQNELEQRVQECEKAFGCGKVNLVHSDGSNEGIWACPANEESKTKINDDHSVGEKVTVLLMNVPLGWGGKWWGSEVTARTQGKSRPIAKLSDQ